ncbi:hypothetical protein [Flavobacterium sp. U410]
MKFLIKILCLISLVSCNLKEDKIEKWYSKKITNLPISIAT